MDVKQVQAMQCQAIRCQEKETGHLYLIYHSITISLVNIFEHQVQTNLVCIDTYSFKIWECSRQKYWNSKYLILSHTPEKNREKVLKKTSKIEPHQNKHILPQPSRFIYCISIIIISSIVIKTKIVCSQFDTTTIIINPFQSHHTI